MALNWAMISEDGSKPVPLPGEKIFYSAERCNLSLDFTNQSKSWKANGTAFVTSQRVLFLRQPPIPAPADPSLSSQHLRTLSVPLKQFVDTRYLIPIFSAPHFEANVIPSVDGGLPQRQAGQASNVGLMKIWFNEGGGMSFRDAIEEVKSRREEGSSNIEALPLYEPSSQGSQGATASATTQSRHAARSDSLPEVGDMEAAHVAREHEEQERQQPPGQMGNSRSIASGPESPPAYQA
ncbi:hypothetical protein CBS101457_000984 [Exobasidium rhododendri]|nr:hypothetical protein CBS101457_000984 [Exobasidium rhododendri]